MRTEEKLVTPEMAKMWLTKNKRNRALNKRRVEGYAKEIREGNWYLHHQGVAFYEDGALADGQHRLAAVVSANISVRMLVSWGVPEESGVAVDVHQPRRMHQAIKISGLAEWIGQEEVAIARMMMTIAANGSVQTNSPTDIVNYCEAHVQSILFVCHAMPTHRKHVTTALTKGAIACAWYYEDEPRLQEFCDVLVSGMAKGEADKAAILAREWLLVEKTNGVKSRMDAAKRVMRGIKAFCEQQPISKLYQPQEFIYTPPPMEALL